MVLYCECDIEMRSDFFKTSIKYIKWVLLWKQKFRQKRYNYFWVDLIVNTTAKNDPKFKQKLTHFEHLFGFLTQGNPGINDEF